MRNKYNKVGLNYDLIVSHYPDLNNYEETVNCYLSDPFFKEMKEMLMSEDYELAKDAVKGLFILAQQLYIYPLYIALMDVYEDLCEEVYEDVRSHYDQVLAIHKEMEGVFHV